MTKAELEIKVEELEELVEDLQEELDNLNEAYTELESENYNLYQGVSDVPIRNFDNFLFRMQSEFSEKFYSQFLDFVQDYRRFYNE